MGRVEPILLFVMACTACTGTLVTDGSGGGEGDPLVGGADAAQGGGSGNGSGGAAPVDIQGPPVRAHVQAFANLVCAEVSACQPSTYDGHHPSADLALDILVSDIYGEHPSDDNALGDAVADYVLAQKESAGIRYLIWRQRYNNGTGWEAMEDRGSITQNHYDHVHVGFEESQP